MMGASGFLENSDFAIAAGDAPRCGVENRDRNQDPHRRHARIVWAEGLLCQDPMRDVTSDGVICNTKLAAASPAGWDQLR